MVDYEQVVKAVNTISSVCSKNKYCMNCPLCVDGYNLCGITGVNMNATGNYELRPDR